MSDVLEQLDRATALWESLQAEVAQLREQLTRARVLLIVTLAHLDPDSILTKKGQVIEQVTAFLDDAPKGEP